jgi:hypothetical protein
MIKGRLKSSIKQLDVLSTKLLSFAQASYVGALKTADL